MKWNNDGAHRNFLRRVPGTVPLLLVPKGIISTGVLLLLYYGTGLLLVWLNATACITVHEAQTGKYQRTQHSEIMYGKSSE
jgi:hypothetical protein